jgi:hypothetical protein
MCLIVDANNFSRVLSPRPCRDLEPIKDALFRKRARAIYGGELAREYLKVGSLLRLLQELDRQGVFRRVPDAVVDRMTERVRQEGHCISNDQHIIALARISRVRLLCTNDKDLHGDFTNPHILKPPGNIYQRRSHQHLIRKHCKNTD